MLFGPLHRCTFGTAMLLASCLLISGCSPSVELFSQLSEADANEVVSTLMGSKIKARKTLSKQGFVVTIDEPDLARAASLLKARGMPRQPFAAMGDVFKKDGMISTPMEEHGRYIYALSQELERTLSQIDGVLVARVHPVLPERPAPGEPLLPSSCAVLIKHRPGWDSGAYEERIRRLVISGVPGLSDSAAKVSIVFVPADVANLPGMEAAGALPRESAAGGWRAALQAGVGVLAAGALLALGYFAFQRFRTPRRLVGDADA